MAGIYSALGELDRMRKMAGRRVSDLVTDPLGVLTQQADALRNTQRGVDPVINAAGAGMRPIPREEQVSRMTQQALDTYAGGLGMLGHTVFHGSPRAFSKFDKAKMGTGEGNQAFGKGLYVAENPEVAKEYLNVGLSMDPSKATYGGKKFKGAEFPETSLYKVDIPDEVIPNMLEWDKPLKEQPATVQKALKKLGVTQTPPAAPEAVEAAKEAYRANPSRENLQAMNALMNQGRNIMGSDIIKQGLATEEALQQAGIPGIKYLDAGSRGGGGTSNMVVFSPEMMRILERNGEATGARPWAAGEWGGRAPTEFEARHAAAQRNAALPVEQGGLGLGPQNTPQERASAMGFEGGWAHGSPNPGITDLRSSKIGAEGRGAYATNYLPEASTYSGNESGATVYPMMVNRGRTMDTGAGSEAYAALNAETDSALSDALRGRGRDSITAEQPPTPQWVVDAGAPAMPTRKHFVSENPANFRSPFAAFDPMKRHDADMLGFASPQLLGGMGLGGAVMAAYGLQDDQEGIFSRLGQYLRQRGMQ